MSSAFFGLERIGGLRWGLPGWPVSVRCRPWVQPTLWGLCRLAAQLSSFPGGADVSIEGRGCVPRVAPAVVADDVHQHRTIVLEGFGQCLVQHLWTFHTLGYG